MITKENLPQHIAIIMDGNGRWAQKRDLPRTEGHREGIKRIKEILRAVNELGIKYLTLFAFSLENWKRPKTEVSMLMRSLDNFLSKNINEFMDNNMRFSHLGRLEGLPDYLKKKLNSSQEKTKNNSGVTVNLAFNYGSRQEILQAVKSVAKDVLDKKVNLEDLDEEKFSRYLYTKDTPDPELLIRTSAQMRLSNFLLWQSSYTEFYFTKTYWPDFKRKDFEEAIINYQARVRRFGSL